MPKAMGTFNDSWTLDCVCDACNNFFSGLELTLGRDSVEAMKRVDFGVKPPTAVLDFHYQRMSATVIESERHQGLRVEMVPDGDQVLPAPVPQIGFRLPDQESWTFLTLKELTSERVATFNAAPKVHMQIVAPAGAGFAELLARMNELGIPFGQESETLNQSLHDSADPLKVEFLVNIDIALLRAAAKIGFNYATKVLGAKAMRGAAFDAALTSSRRAHVAIRLLAPTSL